MRRRRHLSLAGLVTAAATTVGLLTGLAPAAPAQTGSRLDQAGLERLRDTLVAAAPVGSAAHVDPKTGTVVLRVPAGGRTAAVEGAATRHSAQVRVLEGAAAASTTANLYGGMRMETAFGERYCSTGVYATGGGWTWMLTAGHCVQGGHANTSVWYTTGGYNAGGLIGVGTNITPSFPGDDYGAVQISRISPHRPQPYVLENGRPVPIHAMDDPPVHMEVCKTGQTTGTTCGYVRELDVSVHYHEGVVSGLIATTVCTGHGDSGGPLFMLGLKRIVIFGRVYWVRLAYGIVSGGDLFGCEDPNYRSYHQPITEILSAYGLTPVRAPVS